MSKTQHIQSPAQFSQLLASSRILITDFYADWCGPCKAIAPIYEQLSQKLSRPNIITFTKVNTESQQDIARTYNVTALPTFMIFKNGREVQRIKGADPKQLDAAIKKLAAEASQLDSAADSSSAVTGDDWSGATLPRGYADVNSSVDVRGLDFANVDSEAGSARDIFNPSAPSSLASAKGKTKTADGASRDWIQSDTDEQLMMYIPFQSTLKVHTLQLTSCISPENDNIMRPRTVHIYLNRTNLLAFDETESITATQTITLEESDYDKETMTAKLELRFVKFQKVTSLVIFVADGLGDGEKTRIDRLRVIGETGEARQMGKLEKIGDEQGE